MYCVITVYSHRRRTNSQFDFLLSFHSPLFSLMLHRPSLPQNFLTSLYLLPTRLSLSLIPAPINLLPFCLPSLSSVSSPLLLLIPITVVCGIFTSVSKTRYGFNFTNIMYTSLFLFFHNSFIVDRHPASSVVDINDTAQ